MICPNCQSDVSVTEKDFGALFNCPKCQSAYFINFDGAPEYSDLPAPDLSITHDAISEPLATLDSSDFQEVVPSFEQPIADHQLGVNQDFQSLDNNDFVSLDSYSSNEGEGVGSLLDPKFGESAFSNIAADISNFGNSETQITSLNYDLRISGLDTREDLLAFKELIEDSRFAWDVSDLMKQIKGGALFLPRLNPVQAYILAKRLHFLDLELKWKQNVLE